jgi:hypothetical protein
VRGSPRGTCSQRQRMKPSSGYGWVSVECRTLQQQLQNHPPRRCNRGALTSYRNVDILLLGNPPSIPPPPVHPQSCLFSRVMERKKSDGELKALRNVREKRNVEMCADCLVGMNIKPCKVNLHMCTSPCCHVVCTT